MERSVRKEWVLDWLKKYRFVVLILLIGMILMLLPESEEEAVPEPSVQQEVAPDLQESLSRLLSLIEGAGKVEVLLTLEQGEEICYQMDETVSGGDIRKETVLITGSDRSGNGLVRRVTAPVYQGAVVVSQGAQSASVRLALVEAVKSATGLSSDKITVLKMK